MLSNQEIASYNLYQCCKACNIIYVVLKERMNQIMRSTHYLDDSEKRANKLVVKHINGLKINASKDLRDRLLFLCSVYIKEKLGDYSFYERNGIYGNTSGNGLRPGGMPLKPLDRKTENEMPVHKGAKKYCKSHKKNSRINSKRAKWINDMHNGVLTHPHAPGTRGEPKTKRRRYTVVSVPMGGQNGKKHH